MLIHFDRKINDIAYEKGAVPREVFILIKHRRRLILNMINWRALCILDALQWLLDNSFIELSLSIRTKLIYEARFSFLGCCGCGRKQKKSNICCALIPRNFYNIHRRIYLESEPYSSADRRLGWATLRNGKKKLHPLVAAVCSSPSCTI